MLKDTVNKVKKPLTVALLGQPDADQELISKRLSVCHACPFMKSSFMGDSCGTFFLPSLKKGEETCGCTIEDKVTYTKESCPQGKW